MTNSDGELKDTTDVDGESKRLLATPQTTPKPPLRDRRSKELNH